MKNKLVKIILKNVKLIVATSLMAFGLSVSSVYAHADGPDLIIKSTLTKALAELDTRRVEFKEDSTKLFEAIERVFSPVINFELFSKAVLGNHWRTASQAQRSAFVTEFKTQLLTTYATAVFEYSGEKINYLPFANPENKDRVKVVTEFVTSTGEIVPMIFSLSIRNDTQWKVYNVKIETTEATVELIPLFRSDFRSRISSKGLDAVIAEMKLKNSQR